MLKVYIHDQLKCFPFESIEAAQKMLELAKPVCPNSAIAKLDEKTLDLYIEGSPCKDLFIVVSSRKNRDGFYDNDGYVFLTFGKPFYTLV